MDVSKIYLLGVQIHDLPIDNLLAFIVKTVSQNQRAIISNVNVHAMNLAYQIPKFRQFLNESDVVFCDGFGVKWGAKLLGYCIHNRYTPPDWIDLLCEECVQHNMSMYFLGAKTGVAEEAAVRLKQKHPLLQIVGCHHGFFDKQCDSAENQAIRAEINRLNPDILILGFGMPTQELWLRENWDKINANVAIPAGALFDYVAQVIPRGPRWLTDRGFEWLGRLIIEPRRLWKRYIIGNPLFLWRVIKQRFGFEHFD